jgi:hypothetical protein
LSCVSSGNVERSLYNNNNNHVCMREREREREREGEFAHDCPKNIRTDEYQQ